MSGAAPPAPWPEGLGGVAGVRLARPTGRLAEIRRFYVDGVGLPVIGGFEDHAGFDGIILGLPGLAHQLEFTQASDAAIDEGQAPAEDHNVVLYFGDAASAASVARRLAAMGFAVVAPPNPYWSDHGAIAVADPDGWHLILMPQPPGH